MCYNCRGKIMKSMTIIFAENGRIKLAIARIVEY
jgi:hypothetical protein